MENTGKGKMTVQEAGKRGGAKGGPRVRGLIEEGKRTKTSKQVRNKTIHTHSLKLLFPFLK